MNQRHWLALFASTSLLFLLCGPAAAQNPLTWSNITKFNRCNNCKGSFDSNTLALTRVSIGLVQKAPEGLALFSEGTTFYFVGHRNEDGTIVCKSIVARISFEIGSNSDMLGEILHNKTFRYCNETGAVMSSLVLSYNNTAYRFGGYKFNGSNLSVPEAVETQKIFMRNSTTVEFVNLSSPLGLHSLDGVVVGDVAILFGGTHLNGTISSSTIIYSFQTNTFELVASLGTGPLGRVDHSMIQASQDTVFMLGGRSNTAFINDMWEFNITSRSWRILARLPQPCVGHKLVSKRGSIYRVGGSNGAAKIESQWQFSDKWEIDQVGGDIDIDGPQTFPFPDGRLGLLGSHPIVTSKTAVKIWVEPAGDPRVTYIALGVVGFVIWCSIIVFVLWLIRKARRGRQEEEMREQISKTWQVSKKGKERSARKKVAQNAPAAAEVASAAFADATAEGTVLDEDILPTEPGLAFMIRENSTDNLNAKYSKSALPSDEKARKQWLIDVASKFVKKVRIFGVDEDLIAERLEMPVNTNQFHLSSSKLFLSGGNAAPTPVDLLTIAISPTEGNPLVLVDCKGKGLIKFSLMKNEAFLDAICVFLRAQQKNRLNYCLNTRGSVIVLPVFDGKGLVTAQIILTTTKAYCSGIDLSVVLERSKVSRIRVDEGGIEVLSKNSDRKYVDRIQCSNGGFLQPMLRLWFRSRTAATKAPEDSVAAPIASNQSVDSVPNRVTDKSIYTAVPADENQRKAQVTQPTKDESPPELVAKPASPEPSEQRSKLVLDKKNKKLLAKEFVRNPRPSKQSKKLAKVKKAAQNARHRRKEMNRPWVDPRGPSMNKYSLMAAELLSMGYRVCDYYDEIQSRFVPENYYSSDSDDDQAGASNNASEKEGIYSSAYRKKKTIDFVAIPSRDLTILSELGSGSQGTVHLAKWKQKYVAVKKLVSLAQNDVDAFFAEASITFSVPQHENVIRTFGIVQEAARFSLVMELAGRGSLKSILDANYASGVQFDVALQARILRGVAAGLEAISAAGVVHRDVAARNVLVSQSFVAKVSDFGFSRVVGAAQVGVTDSLEGPIRWMAPEAIISQQYSEKSDVWSFGCLMLEVLTNGDKPHASVPDLYAVASKIRDGTLEPLADVQPDWPKAIVNILKFCFQRDPKKRPNFTTIVKMFDDSFEASAGYFTDNEEYDHKLIPQQVTARRSGTTQAAIFPAPQPPPATTKSGAVIVTEAEIQVLKQLGQGAFGTVSLVRWRGQLVAMKRMLNSSGRKQQADFFRESQLMASIPSHRNVLRTLGISNEPGAMFLLTSVMSNGSLDGLLKKIGRRKEPAMDPTMQFYIALSVAVGMAFLHDNGIIHRDLAARNILLSDDWTPKISDFGLSRALDDDEDGGQTQSTVGPIRWMAPECFNNLQYSKKTDVWAFGAFLCELLTLKLPYHEKSLVEVVGAVRSGELDPRRWLDKQELFVPEWALETLDKCVRFNPDERWTFDDLVPFMRLFEREVELNSKAQYLDRVWEHDFLL